eukprot:COSAG02_NODE_2537_length_8579_cov_3.590802_2_plen_168_part_00
MRTYPFRSSLTRLSHYLFPIPRASLANRLVVPGYTPRRPSARARGDACACAATVTVAAAGSGGGGGSFTTTSDLPQTASFTFVVYVWRRLSHCTRSIGNPPASPSLDRHLPRFVQDPILLHFLLASYNFRPPSSATALPLRREPTRHAVFGPPKNESSAARTRLFEG